MNSQLNPDIVCESRPICNDFSMFFLRRLFVSRPNFHILLLWLNLQITKDRCMSHLLHSLNKNVYSVCSYGSGVVIWFKHANAPAFAHFAIYTDYLNSWRLCKGIDFAPYSIIGFLDVHISSSMAVESIIKSTQSLHFSLRQPTFEHFFSTFGWRKRNWKWPQGFHLFC